MDQHLATGKGFMDDGGDGFSSRLATSVADHVLAIQRTVREQQGVIAEVADRIVMCFDASHKLLICGNGGSAADAQHFAAEFVNQLLVKRPAWPAIALTVDSSVLTAIGNDRAYDEVFARQVEAIGVRHDV